MLGKMTRKTFEKSPAERTHNPLRAADLTYQRWCSQAPFELSLCELLNFAAPKGCVVCALSKPLPGSWRLRGMLFAHGHVVICNASLGSELAPRLPFSPASILHNYLTS